MRTTAAWLGGLGAGAAIAATAALVAGPVGPLTSFTSGTPARAADVNANFTAVSTAVNDNAARITAIESRVARDGNVVLVPSTATTGNVLKGTSTFLHDFGIASTFVGVSAGNFASTGTSNTATGFAALNHNTTGSLNAAFGSTALTANTTGAENTAFGAQSLQSNTTDFSNTAAGSLALSSNTTGQENAAHGTHALFANTSGSFNTALGALTLEVNTIGFENTATGWGALRSNTVGSNNTATGSAALTSNTTGLDNIALGTGALAANTTGNGNVAVGWLALRDNVGVAGETNTMRLGTGQNRTFIAGIRGVTTGSATSIPVLIDSSGQLGTLSSSRTVKDDVAAMGDASGVLMQLRPVTFHYKADRDPNGRTLQYGFVAEEVAEVAPGLVAHAADGAVESIYYQFLAPMLLNELQKQQRTLAAQAARIEELDAQRRTLAARIEALEVGAAAPPPVR